MTTETATTAPHVYQAINEVTAVMAGEGLSKSRNNSQQNYKFRGIDDVYNVLARHLANARLCILPRVVDRTVTERQTKAGGMSTYTVLTIDFELVSALDGSKHTIRTVGEAMDTADKSTNKAMSAAMKYACLLAFQIPTEGDNDADAHHYEKGHSGYEKPSSGVVELSAIEREIAALFDGATTTADVAAAEARAAKAIAEKKIVNGGRERLLRLRASAVARLEGR